MSDTAESEPLPHEQNDKQTRKVWSTPTLTIVEVDSAEAFAAVGADAGIYS